MYYFYFFYFPNGTFITYKKPVTRKMWLRELWHIGYYKKKGIEAMNLLMICAYHALEDLTLLSI